jgi:hypothetical protein
MESAAFLQKLRPCGAVDGTVHSAPAEKRGIGGVGNGVHPLFGDVTLDNVNAWFHFRSFSCYTTGSILFTGTIYKLNLCYFFPQTTIIPDCHVLLNAKAPRLRGALAAGYMP